MISEEILWLQRLYICFIRPLICVVVYSVIMYLILYKRNVKLPKAVNVILFSFVCVFFAAYIPFALSSLNYKPDNYLSINYYYYAAKYYYLLFAPVGIVIGILIKNARLKKACSEKNDGCK